MSKTFLLGIILLIIISGHASVIQLNIDQLSILDQIQEQSVGNTGQRGATLVTYYPGDVYAGQADIQIVDGQTKNIQFFGTLSKNTLVRCPTKACYLGWIHNYTIFGERDPYSPVIGYGNAKLPAQPVFEFRVNADDDWTYARHPNLGEDWVQIIEVFLEKINPLTSIRSTSGDLEKYNAYTTVTTANLQDLILKTQVKNLAAGDKVRTMSQFVGVRELVTPNSDWNEILVLDSLNQIKNRAISYRLKLDSTVRSDDQRELIGGFDGTTVLNFRYSNPVKVSSDDFNKINAILATRNEFTLASVNDRRQKVGQILDPKSTVEIWTGPTEADAQVRFQDLVQVIDIQKALAQGDTTASTSTAIRTLQLLSNTTIYDNTKTLWSTTIFGKTAKVQVNVKCYLLVYPTDHKLQCVGTLNYQIFGGVKSITIFNFIQSVSFAWNWSQTYSGNWAFSVYVALPPPVSFIGITFNFNVNWTVTVSLHTTGSGFLSYVIKVAGLATTNVNTDASAGVRVVAIEGGLYISGTLVNAATDPTVTFTYNWVARKIDIHAQWWFWLNAFNYVWGFYYKTWSFWGGWSGRKPITTWNINQVYGKWNILNKYWTVYY